MSYPKRSGPFIHRPRIENRTSKKTSDLIGGTVNERNNKHGIVCLFVCLLEKKVSHLQLAYVHTSRVILKVRKITKFARGLGRDSKKYLCAV